MIYKVVISTILRLKCYIESFYIDIILEQNKIVEHIHNNNYTVFCGKSKMVSFASSIMKIIVGTSARSRFLVKLLCYIAFGSASSACCLLNPTAIILY